MKMLKNRELGVLVEFYDEIFEIVENVTIIGNKSKSTKLKTKKLSSGHSVSWFAQDDWNVIRPLLVRMQDYFLVLTGKHPTMKLVGMNEDARELLSNLENNSLGVKICVYDQKKKKGQKLLDTELLEEIWISKDDYDGLDVTNGSARNSILFRMNDMFNIRSGRNASIKLEKK